MRLNLLTIRISDDTFNIKCYSYLICFFMILENYFCPFI